MIGSPQLLLIGTVAAVGVLHTMVPDHWVPITLIARQRGWSKREVARAAAIAGAGHTGSTLLIGLCVWLAGVAFAARFGNLVANVSSLALIGFGLWVAGSSLRELRAGAGHGHAHARFGVADTVRSLAAPSEHGAGARENADSRDHHRDHAGHHAHPDELSAGIAVEPRGQLGQAVHAHTKAREHHASLPSATAVAAERDAADTAAPPLAERERPSRTTLLLILGSSPMVEGIPAFFAAAKYSPALTAVMGVVFAAATIATYVALCVSSLAGLQRIELGPLERYGEVLSGGFIAVVGLVFLVFPVL